MKRWLVSVAATAIIYGLAIKFNSIWFSFMLGIIASTVIDLIRGRYK